MGRCVVCGLATMHEDAGADGFCRATCVREAEHELMLLVGRLHQLDRLRTWRETAARWQLVLHPSQRREADEGELERAELMARRDRLDRALRAWAVARLSEATADPLGPRPASTIADAQGTSVAHPQPAPRRVSRPPTRELTNG